MAKKQQKNKATTPDTNLDNLNVFWDISPNWETLNYKQKLRRYWYYKYDDKGRVLDESEYDQS